MELVFELLHVIPSHPNSTTWNALRQVLCLTVFISVRILFRVQLVINWRIGCSRSVCCVKIVDLLREYICSGDIIEAQRCLLELEVPHFHHELVYQVSIGLLALICFDIM